MRWRWLRRRARGPVVDVEAQAAVHRSQMQLDAAHRQEPEVRRLVRQLADIREANHFAEMIQSAFREHR